MSNKAAWITEPKGRPLQVKEAPMPKAGKGEVVVKNHAVSINPVDCKHFSPFQACVMANFSQGRFKTTVSHGVASS
jgi:NADPH:quinone reductase-like Zn-dependent oxidoreductase